MALHLYSTIHPNKTKRFTNINDLSHGVFKGIHIPFEVWWSSTLKNTSHIFIASFLHKHSPTKHLKYPILKHFYIPWPMLHFYTQGERRLERYIISVYKYLYSNNGVIENYSYPQMSKWKNGLRFKEKAW